MSVTDSDKDAGSFWSLAQDNFFRIRRTLVPALPMGDCPALPTQESSYGEWKESRADRGEYRVVSDGEKLKWPWGSDSGDLEQAAAQAKWLEEFLTKRTGIQTPVKAVLAIPGWWVEESARKTVAVVNAKCVAQAVEGRAKQPLLTPEQIDLISRQLDERCRDVED